MRIRPITLSVFGASMAVIACGVVMQTVHPNEATIVQLGLFWISLGLIFWLGCVTVLLLLRASLARAIWCSFPGVVGAMALIAWGRGHLLPLWLLGSALLGTLLLSVLIWRMLVPHTPHGST